MAYIGAEPLPGQNREVDDISSGFNNNATAFTLQVNGLNVSPETANNIIVNLGGVIQNPGTDYTIAASTITFTTAPAAGLSFFGIILGAGINTATVADQTIGTSKILDNAVTADKLAHTSVTAGSYTTADITVDAQGRITAAASGTIANAEIADGAITNAKVNASAAIARTKLANVDVVDDTSPQLGGDLQSNGNDIDFADNDRARFGNAGDLDIFHNATNSRIVNATGQLQLESNGSIILGKADLGETYLKAHPDGAVEAYFDNTKRIETLSTGAKVTGRLGIDKTPTTLLNAELSVFAATGDDDASDWGAGGIFQLDHSGTAAANNEVLMIGAVSGGVGQIASGFGFGRESTSNWGTYISFKTHSTSTSNIDELKERWKITSAGHFENNSDSVRIKLGASDDLQIYHDGSNSHIEEGGTGSLLIKGDTVNLGSVSGEYYFRGFENGASVLRFDNATKLETAADRVNITGHLFVNGGNRLFIQNGFQDSTSSIQNIGGSNDSNLNFLVKNSGTEATAFKIQKDSSIELPQDNQKLKFGAGQDLEIFHDGSNSYVKSTNTNTNLIIEGAHGVDIKHGGEEMAKFRPDGSVELYFDNGLKAFTHNSGWRVSGDCFPNGDGNSAMRLGQPNERWHTVFAINGSINTSDEREKTNINKSSLGLDFVNKLKPVTYNWKDESRSKKLHYGLVVQDIIKVLEEENIELNDFGAINDEGKFYGLNYSEFINPLIKAVQELSAKVAALEAA